MRQTIRTLLWPLSALIILLGSLLMVFVPASQDAQAATNYEVAVPAQPAILPHGQIFNDDLYIERGQIIDNDVTVVSGNATVASGGAIHGNLIVMSGDIEIEEGAVVQGDVTAFSGNIDIAGEVQGDVAAASGEIDLANTAHIQGNVSVLSGDIARAEGARIDGGILTGPNLNLPFAGPQFRFNSVPEADQEAKTPVIPRRTLGERIGLFILRMLGAAIITLVVTVLCGLLMAVRPAFVEATARSMGSEPAINFITGLIANLSLLFLVGMLAITICLSPIALVPLLTLLLINLLGWAGVSHRVGRRVANYAKTDIQPAAMVALGALALTAPAGVLWALGGCFRVIMFVGILLVSSAGAGAVILPWLRKLARSDSVTFIPALPASADEPHDDAESTAVKLYAESDTATEITEVPIDVTAPPAEGADFTQIRGIGPVTSQRLRNANITTFAQLAALSAEQVADILGWSTERVFRSEILEQAQAYAR